jgi:transketolase
MKFLAWLRPLAAKFFHRAQLSDEMDQELRSHIQLRADDLERSGIPRAEAERHASSSALTNATKKNPTRPSAATSLKPSFRTSASAFASCENHPDSPSPPY